MSLTNIYRVDFEISKPTNAAGKKDVYRKGVRTVFVEAASSHPKDILVPLTNNVPLASGEVFEVLAVSQAGVGTEGSVVLT